MEAEKQEKSAFESCNEKEQLLILEYLKDLNKAAAARRAGYSENSARQIAYEIFTKPYIKAAVKEKINEIFEDQQELILKVQRELECLSFSDIKDHIDFDNKLQYKTTNETDTRAIESVKVKRSYKIIKGPDGDESFTIEDIDFKMHPKKAALDSLKQMLGVAEKIDLNISSEDQDEAVKAILEKHGIKTEN